MLTRAQCRAARAGLEWSRDDLATRCGLSDRTITDFERGAREPHENNRRAIQSAFEAAGVRFTEEGCICLPVDGAKRNEGLKPDQLTSENDE